jgi:hypothetical protein
MPSLEEYEAVHNALPLRGKTAAIEFGDGGCHTIYRQTTVIGRWTSYEAASVALGKLQQLTGMFEYSLKPSHHWESSSASNCSKCNMNRALDTSPHNEMASSV